MTRTVSRLETGRIWVAVYGCPFIGGRLWVAVKVRGITRQALCINVSGSRRLHVNVTEQKKRTKKRGNLQYHLRP